MTPDFGMRSAHPVFVFVFPSGGHAAPYVALGLVPLEKLTDLGIEGRGGPRQQVAQVLVNGGFGDPELKGGGTDGPAAFDHVHSQLSGPFFFVIGHSDTSQAVS